jgi:Bacterial Ig-like domain
MLKRFVLLVAVMMVTLVALSGVALASGELDQQNLVPTNEGMGGTGIDQRLMLAQTFTAGRTGELDKVSVYLSANTSGPVPGAGNMVAEIYPTDSSGNPNTSTQPLGSGSTPSSSIIPERAQWVDINLSQSAPVTEGTLYALVLHTVDTDPNNTGFAGYLSWMGNGSGLDHYTRGSANYGLQDFFFKTFVTTPPPASSSDTEAPTVAKVTPPATRGANITVQFSEPMDPKTLMQDPNAQPSLSTTVMLVEGKSTSATRVPAKVSCTDASCQTLTLDPDARLGKLKTYTVKIKGGGAASGVKDLAGNVMAQNFKQTFKTKSG